MGARRALTFADRVEISTGCKAGWTVRAIAIHLGRCPSVISREIRRNTYLHAGYQSVHADCQAERKRPGRRSARSPPTRCWRRGCWQI